MKILLVDGKDGRVAQWAADLAAAGWGEVFAASTAEEAAALANTRGVPDLLATAVELPDLDGFTLVEAFRAKIPGMAAVYLATNGSAEHARERANGSPVLEPPLDAATLAQAFTAVLTPPPAAPLDDQGFVGRDLGGYRVEAPRGEGSSGPFYDAVQTSIGRPVELHTLAAERAADEGEVARFLASARAKAAVNQPTLLSVFEAGEADGVYFYTSERRPGATLAEWVAGGQPVDANVLLKILQTVAEAMAALVHDQVPHERLRPEHIVIDAQLRTRLLNIATHETGADHTRKDIASLAQAVARIAPTEGPNADRLQHLLGLMTAETAQVRSWQALVYEIKRCLSSTTPLPAAKKDPATNAAERAAALAARRQRERKRNLILGVVAAVLAIAGGVWAWMTFGVRYGNPALERMIEIPAGPINFLGGTEQVDVPQFWIDAHEVSIGQFADFLRWAERNPAMARNFAPEGMAPGTSFVPKGWADEVVDGVTKPGYFAIARAGGEYEGTKLTLDSPVFNVNWYAAYAYATWKSRRLPNEREWEKAALGTDGRAFPWGAADEAGRANLGGSDGHAKWAPVNAMEQDVSPYGVQGMAGNVSEYTLTVSTTDSGATASVIRGGNWSDATLDMRRRDTNLASSESSPTVGFRTVTTTPP